MPTVTFILGLCGAGKSWNARQMTGAVVIDEGFHERINELHAALQVGRDVVLTEIGFCREENRRWIIDLLKAEHPGVRMEWLCIENDLEKANRNCRRPERHLEKPNYDAEEHVRLNHFVSPLYTYPLGATILPMWPG